MKLLLIGVDPEEAEKVSFAAQVRWPETTVLVADDERAALCVLGTQKPTLVILQAPFAHQSVRSTIQRIRSACVAPLIVLGPRSSADDMTEAQALESGADDYVLASASLITMVARMVAAVRRASSGNSRDETVNGGSLLLNPATYDVFVEGRSVKLTKTEFHLLHLLMKHQGTVVTHGFLETALWGSVSENAGSVKKYVQRLRSKIGDNQGEPKRITSIYGVGYQFVPDQAGAPGEHLSPPSKQIDADNEVPTRPFSRVAAS